MKKYNFKKVLLFLILFPLAVCGQKKKSETKKPNISIIMTDDPGYGDPVCYGGTNLKTPNMSCTTSKTDISETTNLVDKNPEIVKKMRARIEEIKTKHLRG